ATEGLHACSYGLASINTDRQDPGCQPGQGVDPRRFAARVKESGATALTSCSPPRVGLAGPLLVSKGSGGVSSFLSSCQRVWEPWALSPARVKGSGVLHGSFPLLVSRGLESFMGPCAGSPSGPVESPGCGAVAEPLSTPTELGFGETGCTRLPVRLLQEGAGALARGSRRCP